jgi:hypothetical protein
VLCNILFGEAGPPTARVIPARPDREQLDASHAD